MRVEQVHEYWKDPSVAKGVNNTYRDFCLPEFYLERHESSEMLIETVKRHLPDRDSTILELGANCGRNLFHLNKAGYRNVSGVEISRKAVDLGLLNFGAVCGSIEVSSIEDYLLKPSEFDLVFTMGVLMHIHPDSNWVFKNMADVARKCIITIENEMDNWDFKWARNYKQIFRGMGWRQVESSVFLPSSKRTTMRVFTNGWI